MFAYHDREVTLVLEWYALNKKLLQDLIMQIDSTTIIISAIASLFFIIPIIWDQVKKSKESEKN